jgi:uncharacterized damage-inducible protein DinB
VTYYTPKEFADSLRTVRKNTIQIAEDIPEDKYDFSPAPDTRTVGRLLAHIALGHRFQQRAHQTDRPWTTLEGVDFPSLMQTLMAEEQQPRTKAQILDLLRSEGEAWASWIEGLSEDFLAQRVAMPAGFSPATKSRFEMLLSTKEHEMHHRGQLMVIERLLGIVPHLTRQMQQRIAQAQAATRA